MKKTQLTDNRHDQLEALGFSDDESSDVWMERLRTAVDPEPLSTLGRFDLIEELGRGAQGIVYRAWDPDTKRHVAIKSIRAGRGAPASAAARYQRELEAVGALDHPSVVALYGAEWIDGRPILIMPWVDGRTFSAWCASLPIERGTQTIVRAMIEICHGVHHAHRHGILHRDLKPSNLIVDGDGHPRILDFGLARVIDDTVHPCDDPLSGQASVQTRPGVFVGTERYAAPEQRAAETQVDVRADAYALGVILRESVADRPDAEAADFQAIISCVTADDPDARYQSVETFRFDLQAWIDGAPVSARPLTALQSMCRTARRHPRTSGAAILAAMVLIGFTIALGVLYQRERAQRQHAHAMQSLYEALLNPAGTVLPARLISVESQLEVAADRLRRDGDQLSPESRAHLHNVLADRYGGFDLWFKGEPHAVEAARLLDELGIGDHPERALSLYHRGRAATFRRQASAVDLHRNALLMTRRLYGDRHARTASSLLGYAHAGMMTERLDTTVQEAHFTESIDCYRLIGQADSADAAQAASSYGAFLLHNARFSEAESQFRRSSELLARRRGAADYRWLLACVGHARSLELLNRPDTARDTLTSGIERTIDAGELDSEVYLQWSAGRLEARLGAFDDALIAFDRAWAAEDSVARMDDKRVDDRWVRRWRRAPGLLFDPIGVTLEYASVLFAADAGDDAARLLHRLLDEIGDDHPYAPSARQMLGDA